MAEAAIVPYALHEHSVIYKSDTWEDLVKLLTSPTEFLGAEGMKNSPLRWSLLSNATIVLEPFDLTPESAVRFAAAFGWSPDGDGDNLPAKEKAKEEEKSVSAASSKMEASAFTAEDFEARLRSQCEQARDYFYSSNKKEGMSKGLFVAEFAVYTHTLYIRYKVPDEFRYPKRDCKGEKERFRGWITRPTLIEIEGLGRGNLHFDIEMDIGLNEVHRANQIVDFIENPYRAFQHLAEHVHAKATLKSVGAPDPLTLVDNDNKPSFRPNYIFGVRRPQIVIEGASKPDLPDACGVCIDGQTTVVKCPDGSTCYVIGGILYKCYQAPDKALQALKRKELR